MVGISLLEFLSLTSLALAYTSVQEEGSKKEIKEIKSLIKELRNAEKDEVDDIRYKLIEKYKTSESLLNDRLKEAEDDEFTGRIKSTLDAIKDQKFICETVTNKLNELVKSEKIAFNRKYSTLSRIGHKSGYLNLSNMEADEGSITIDDSMKLETGQGYVDMIYKGTLKINSFLTVEQMQINLETSAGNVVVQITNENNGEISVGIESPAKQEQEISYPENSMSDTTLLRLLPFFPSRKGLKFYFTYWEVLGLSEPKKGKVLECKGSEKIKYLGKETEVTLWESDFGIGRGITTFYVTPDAVIKELFSYGARFYLTEDSNVKITYKAVQVAVDQLKNSKDDEVFGTFKKMVKPKIKEAVFDEKATAEFVNWTGNRITDCAVKRSYIVYLTTLPYNKAIVNHISSYLRENEDSEVVVVALLALKDLDAKENVDSIAALLTSIDPDVRANTAKTLGLFKAKQFMKELGKLTDDNAECKIFEDLEDKEGTKTTVKETVKVVLQEFDPAPKTKKK
ncbi:MAG: HEAT repeat domain-containing protein [Planctomycetes bacterium]|nr:HEAT repeat domain-containing protein [Planctomycetota bacterium]